MAQGKENYAVGEELPAADQNQISKNANDGAGLRDTINAAETISAMRPVFLDDSSNTWKYCDANDTARLRFDGFILEDGSSGNAAKVQCAGIVRGFSGLDAGKDYYVQDDGTIGTTPGTYNVKVGIAISASEILIKKNKKIDIITGSRGAAESSGAVNYNHNLGAVPRLIKIKMAANSPFVQRSDGTWKDGSQNCIFWGDVNGPGRINSGIIICIYITNNGSQTGAISSVNSSQITITWTKVSDGGANMDFWIELYE